MANYKIAKGEEYRWEFCPYCRDGFPDYLGERDGKHWFNCTHPSCEAQFKVQVGVGNWDKRLGMKLDPDVVYLEKCDHCQQRAAVKVKDLRFTCYHCFKK